MHFPILSSLSQRLQLTPARRLVLLLGAPPLLAVAVLAAVLFSPGLRPGAVSAGAAAAPPALTPADAAAAADGAATAALPPAGGLLVEVTGAVVSPGLYHVNKGDRVSAAIAAAGGLSPSADPNRLPNMAARLKDGSQVKVAALGSPTAPKSTTGSTAAPRAAAVSLNEASVDQLAAVPGFTPDLASAVIRYRTEYGGFSTTRELVDVLNMSEADYLLARKYVRV
jgi:competence protein ComEA